VVHLQGDVPVEADGWSRRSDPLLSRSRVRCRWKAVGVCQCTARALYREHVGRIGWATLFDDDVPNERWMLFEARVHVLPRRRDRALATAGREQRGCQHPVGLHEWREHIRPRGRTRRGDEFRHRPSDRHQPLHCCSASQKPRGSSRSTRSRSIETTSRWVRLGHGVRAVLNGRYREATASVRCEFACQRRPPGGVCDRLSSHQLPARVSAGLAFRAKRGNRRYAIDARRPSRAGPDARLGALSIHAFTWVQLVTGPCSHHAAR
jgi:hypothetical protein